MSRSEIVEKIVRNGVVAVIRMNNPQRLIRVAEAVNKGGIGGIEITMTVPGAIKIIEEAARTIGKDMNIGVGSVLNAQVAQDAINAGANYVVSPIFKKEIIDTAHRNNVPAMPGAFTPTEIQSAYEAGADIVKVFPADVVGMAFFKGILAPMPHLRLMPTGGVTLTNAGEWLKSGACAVGVGSALLDKKAIENEDYDKLTENARILMGSINEYRAGAPKN